METEPKTVEYCLLHEGVFGKVFRNQEYPEDHHWAFYTIIGFSNLFEDQTSLEIEYTRKIKNSEKTQTDHICFLEHCADIYVEELED